MGQFSKASMLACNEPTYIFHRGESFLECGEFPTAIRIYRTAIRKIRELEPKDSPPKPLYLERRLAMIYYLYGQILLDQKRYQQSLEYLQAAFDYGWNQDNVQLRIVFVYIGMKELDIALQLLCDLITRWPQNVSVLVLRARIYVLMDMIDFVNIDVDVIKKVDKGHHAIPQLEKYVMTKAVLYKNVASEMIIKDDIGLSVISLNHAIELDPEDWTLLFKRGVLLSQLGHFESSLIDITNCLEKLRAQRQNGVDISDGRERNVLDHLGSIYNQMGIISFQQNRPDMALVYFQDAIQSNDAVSTVHRNQSDCYFLLKQYEQAKNSLERALELSPDNEEARGKLSNIYAILGQQSFAKGHYNAAISNYTSALSFNSEGMEEGDQEEKGKAAERRQRYLFERARALMILERVEDSRTDLLTIVRDNPGHADAVGMLNKLTRNGWQGESSIPFKGKKPLKDKAKRKGLERQDIQDLPSLGLYILNDSKNSKIE
ncbi:MAG: hypothetical protein SGCHY_000353 [Lobulomycetales sp.]